MSISGAIFNSRTAPLFRLFAEMFSIVVAFAIFTVFWNARRFLDNGCFLVLGSSLPLSIMATRWLHALAGGEMPTNPLRLLSLPLLIQAGLVLARLFCGVSA